MALVTVQRSPSPSNSAASLEDSQDGLLDEEGSSSCKSKSNKSKAALKKLKKLFTTIRFVHKLRRNFIRFLNFSENYFVVKGAALILPQSECVTRHKALPQGGGDIHKHLQRMSHLLRPQETIKVAVKLETAYPNRHRYLAVVASKGRQDTDESVLLGIDVGEDKTTIGLVIPVWGDTKIRLDGDGGMIITSTEGEHIFKPVSVQAMWSALQSLNKMREVAAINNYYPKGLTHTWITYYQVRLSSEQSCMNEWELMEDLESKRKDPQLPSSELEVKDFIKVKLREIMSQVDLEEVTCKYVRTTLEESLNMNFESQKVLIDEEMIIIMRQMDAPSQIFDYLYLGSEWNASNLDELKKNGVKYILNITREIDNFYPDMCEYCNIRVYDIPQSDLLKHWDKTYKFIKKAKHHHSKVLVHCKMGISRSASSVIAFAMKEYGWSLEEAMKYVKEKRSVINPNKGFRKQLVTYEGILDASKQRHNTLWKSVSENDLTNQQLTLMSDTEEKSYDTMQTLNLDFTMEDDAFRPRSWSPADGPSEILMKARQFAADVGSTDEEIEDESESEYTELHIDSDHSFAIPMTIEQLEQYEISSRSADSLDIDEAFLEYDPNEHETPVINFRNGPVVLLRYKELDDTDENIHSPLSENEISEESDFEDYYPGGGQRKQIGFYDVSMLTGYEGGYLPHSHCSQQHVEENGDCLATIHPDIQLELAISEYKKKLRIAKLLLYQEKEDKSNTPQIIVSSSTSKRSRQYKVKSNLQYASKLRPDDFWIKDLPPSPKDTGQDTEEVLNIENIPVLHIEGVCDTDANIDSNNINIEKEMSNATETVNIKTKEDPSDKTFVTKLQLNIPGDSNDLEELKTEKQDESLSECNSDKDSVLEADIERDNSKINSPPGKEVGVWQHYDKESIPWSPGTVKRTRLEMEEKSKEVSVKGAVEKIRSMSVSSGNMSNSPDGSQETLSIDLSDMDKNYNETPQVVFPVEKITENNQVAVKTPPKTSSPRSVQSDTLDELSTQKQLERPNMLDLDTRSQNEDKLKKRESTSVYEMEDIELEPDIVSRIKKEIERRESSSNSDAEENESKVVQRSSSWRNEKLPIKSRFDRNSPRRKTVLPVVRPSPTREIVVDVMEETKVNQMQDERKLLKDEGYQGHTSATFPSLNIPKMERDTRSASPFHDDCIHIRSGSVKEHKQQIETMFDKNNSTKDVLAVTQPTSLPVCPIPNVAVIEQSECSANTDPTQMITIKNSCNNELSPAVEKVLSKSPTLQRKIQEVEVIACHTPDMFGETVSDLTAVSPSGRQQGLQEAQGVTSNFAKAKLAKSSSAPFNMTGTAFPKNETIQKRNDKSLHRKEACAKTMSLIEGKLPQEDEVFKRYEDEGIEWNIGTVKQQLEAIELKVKEDTVFSVSPTINMDPEQDQGFTSSDKDDVLLVRSSDEKQEYNTVSNVQKIKQSIENNLVEINPKLPQLEKTKSSLERKHSLGSKTDVHKKRRSIIDVTNVGRSSSFKENSPTKFDSEPEFSNQTSITSKRQLDTKMSKNQKSGNKCETVIATHVPTSTSTLHAGTSSQKQLVIIPKKSFQSNTFDQSDKTSPNVSGVDITNTPTNMYAVGSQSQCNEVFSKEQCQELEGAKSCDVLFSAVPSLSPKCAEDVKVKHMVDIFESSPEHKLDITADFQRPQTSKDKTNNNVPNKPTTECQLSTLSKDSDSASFSPKNRQSNDSQKIKKLHGKSHPLAKLSQK